MKGLINVSFNKDCLQITAGFINATKKLVKRKQTCRYFDVELTDSLQWWMPFWVWKLLLVTFELIKFT